MLLRLLARVSSAARLLLADAFLADHPHCVEFAGLTLAYALRASIASTLEYSVRAQDTIGPAMFAIARDRSAIIAASLAETDPLPRHQQA